MTGKFDATQTERSERYLNFGKTFALVVNDVAIWDALQPCIGPKVQVSIVTV